MQQATATFYDRFTVLYPLVDFFLKPQKQVLFHEINSLPNGHLLEIGVGNGTHLPLYKKHKITGIDTSLRMLERARKLQPRGVELLQMNGESLSFPKAHFDYVVLSHVVAVVAHPQQLLQEACRVLKPGGSLLILNHFTPNNWLQYVDRSFATVSGMLHFKSFFPISKLAIPQELSLIKETGIGPLSYFKLLIFVKK